MNIGRRLVSAAQLAVVAPVALAALVVLSPVLAVWHGAGLLLARRAAFKASVTSEGLTLSSRSECLTFHWAEIVGAATVLLAPVLVVKIITVAGESKAVWVLNLRELQSALELHGVPMHGMWPSGKPSPAIGAPRAES